MIPQYEDTCEQTTARESLDREMAGDTGRRMKQAEEGRKYHREQAAFHEQQAVEAERTIEACQAALQVLDPPKPDFTSEVHSVAAQSVRY